MAPEEVQLVGDERLVDGTVVDVEVIDAGISPQLALRGAAGGGNRRAGLGDAVGLADADEPGAVQLGGVASGSVGAAEQPARGDAVAPARVLADLHHASPALLPTRRVDQRRLVRLADRGEVATPSRGG